MLNRLIAFSLKNRLFIVVAALLIAGVGSWQVLRMPVDVLPDLNRPTVTIMTEAHAMVPEDVEQLVTLPLERMFSGATGVRRVRSSSGQGLSVTYVEFDWGQDIYRCRQIVQEKLQLARNLLPEGIEPAMMPISSIMGQIQMIGVYSKDGDRSVDEIRAVVDNDLRYRLSSLQGVAKVITMGGAPRQLQVEVDEGKLRAHGVSILQVAEAIEKSNMNAGGGFLTLGQKAPLVTVTGLLHDENDLALAVVKETEGRPILIRDVATVSFGPALIRVGDAGVSGHDGVIVIVMKQPDVDTVALTQRVNQVLEESETGLLQGLEVVPDLFQLSSFIDRAIHNVLEAVRDGGLLVVLVLFLFLGNLRSTVITLTAIPLSLALTALVFSFLDIGINTMTLGGIAVAVGALVDDAIVDMENIFRRLKENARLPVEKRRPVLRVIYQASCEVRSAILVGTALVVLVYLPLFFLTGMEGRLFAPIGLAYIVSVVSSLLVAVTVTPVLCQLLLPAYVERTAKNETWIVRQLKAVVARLIRGSVRCGSLILVALGIAVACSIAGLLTRGTTFLPAFDEGTLQINMVLPPDTGLDASVTYGRKLEILLRDVDGVKSIARRTGRAAGDEHAEGVNMSEVLVNIDENAGREREEVISEIRTLLKDNFPGVATAVDQPLAHLISHMLSGVKAQVAIKIFGPDLTELRRIASEVEPLIRAVPDVADLVVEPQVLLPNVEIEPNRNALADWGLTVSDIASTVELGLGGEAISRLIQGRYSFPVTVFLQNEDRATLERIEDLYLTSPKGETVRLGDVAKVRRSLTPNNINHENGARRVVLQHNVSGRSLGEVVADVEAALQPVRERVATLPGYRIELGGQFEAQREATSRILLLSLAALFLMTGILYMHFKSMNLAIQVLGSIPMAMIGAAAFVVWSGQLFSVATLVGLISLCGIATRNAILLLDHYLHLMKEEGAAFDLEMLVRAGQERMVPVVMTALTSGIALLPLALSPGEPGKELLYPVATVIIGGLISSTLLDFIVRPVLFWKFGRRPAEAYLQQSSENQDHVLFDDH